MVLRIDRLQIELPRPTKADPNSAAALQELLGRKFGEMSTLNNYLFQSFDFRNKGKLNPFYSLVTSITAEEFGYVELVTNGVKLVARGPDSDQATHDVTPAPFAAIRDARNTGNFFMGGGAALPVDSLGTPRSGNYVSSTANLILDLLHNFFLEGGARIHKLRVYETVNDPVSREVCRHLMGRGAVHAHAYGLVLKHLTSVGMTKMLPIPNVPGDKVPEARRFMQEGTHRRLYRFSPND